MPYYEQEKPFVRSRARSEAECPLQALTKRTGTYVPYYEQEKALCS